MVIVCLDNQPSLVLQPDIIRDSQKVKTALAGVAQWTECQPVRFPVGAHAWVAGQVPSAGCARDNYTLMFLSLPKK